MKRSMLWVSSLAASIGAVALLAATQPAPAAKAGGEDSPVARGRYLVTVAGCNDCHTPWKMGAQGPEPDLSRMLSGHPQNLAMPPAPKLSPGPWAITGSGTMTAWAGPWGVSFSANITPDEGSGIGSWSEKDFVDSMRQGKHLGRGRGLLPPMPWPNLAKATDEDLKAIYAYLKTIPPIANQVPEPIPPPPAPKH